jgi:hypothetical protein
MPNDATTCSGRRAGRHIRARWLGAGLVIAGLLGVCSPALSEDAAPGKPSGGKLMVQYAPNTIHYNYSPDHAKQSWLVGAEYIWTNRWLVGFSYFNNSFDQKCQFIYGGRIWKLYGEETRNLYFKIGAGALIGYREPYDNKIPLNDNGIGVGVIPGLGIQYDRFNVQMNILGTAGLMFTVGYDLLR